MDEISNVFTFETFETFEGRETAEDGTGEIFTWLSPVGFSLFDDSLDGVEINFPETGSRATTEGLTGDPLTEDFRDLLIFDLTTAGKIGGGMEGSPLPLVAAASSIKKYKETAH